MLYLVRHGDAGDKHRWTGPDGRRPLTDLGLAQARGLADRLRADTITAIVSSPALRCVQTVQPLARRHGLEVRSDSRLDTRADPDDAVKLLLYGSHAGEVWCTHRELISEVIARLRRLGAPIDATAQWPKGSAWRLEVASGAVVGATYLAPTVA